MPVLRLFQILACAQVIRGARSVRDSHDDGAASTLETIRETSLLDANFAKEGVRGCDEPPPCATQEAMKLKDTFFDMIHSNNAARIRIFIRQYVPDDINVCMVTYADMRCPWFDNINPNKKVPGLFLKDGKTLIESNVIFEYIVDKATPGWPLQQGNIMDTEMRQAWKASPDGNLYPDFRHRDLDPWERAEVNLKMRVHDLYVASPNCNQKGCTHSQGGLYLPPPGDYDNTGGRRQVTDEDRAGKFQELWTRWTWLESEAKGPYLSGNYLSMADFNWFPTAVFMEFLLVHVAEWPAIFADVADDGSISPFYADADRYDPENTGWTLEEDWKPADRLDDAVKKTFPKLSAWYPTLLKMPVWRKVRDEILGFWVNERHLDLAVKDWRANKATEEWLNSADKKYRINRFDPIKAAIHDAKDQYAWTPKVIEDGTLVLEK